MSAIGTTIHRPPGGDPNRVRVVPDGFRWSVFLLPPAGLAARRLWLLTLGWFAMVAGLATLVGAGFLAPGAAIVAALLVDLILALDAPELERRRLARHGWSTVAFVGPLGFVDVAPAQVAGPFGDTAAQAPTTDVIGLFPS